MYSNSRRSLHFLKGMHPYHDEDPLIIEECPQVYFAGCQPKFQTKVIKDEAGGSVVLVTIPKFSESFTFVLFNLRTLGCEQQVVRAFEM